MDQPVFWFSVHAKDKDTSEPLYINMCNLTITKPLIVLFPINNPPQKEGKEGMDQPVFWFSVHAKDKDTSEPLYINMCSMKKVPKPKSDHDGINLFSG